MIELVLQYKALKLKMCMI